jgi:hypothetical protein
LASQCGATPPNPWLRAHDPTAFPAATATELKTERLRAIAIILLSDEAAPRRRIFQAEPLPTISTRSSRVIVVVIVIIVVIPMIVVMVMVVIHVAFAIRASTDRREYAHQDRQGQQKRRYSTSIACRMPPLVMADPIPANRDL